jgi:hypothetical protein
MPTGVDRVLERIIPREWHFIVRYLFSSNFVTFEVSSLLTPLDASMTTEERGKAAEAYEQGVLKAIMATCSLAAGINLPA